MNCSKCNVQNSDGAEICSSCGASLTVPLSTLSARKNRFALTSLVLGVMSILLFLLGGPVTVGLLQLFDSIEVVLLISFFLPFLAAVLAVVFGHLARRQIKRSSGLQSGKGLALAGLIVGYVLVAIFSTVTVFITWQGLLEKQEKAARCERFKEAAEKARSARLAQETEIVKKGIFFAICGNPYERYYDKDKRQFVNYPPHEDDSSSRQSRTMHMIIDKFRLNQNYDGVGEGNKTARLKITELGKPYYEVMGTPRAFGTDPKYFVLFHTPGIKIRPLKISRPDILDTDLIFSEMEGYVRKWAQESSKGKNQLRFELLDPKITYLEEVDLAVVRWPVMYWLADGTKSVPKFHKNNPPHLEAIFIVSLNSNTIHGKGYISQELHVEGGRITFTAINGRQYGDGALLLELAFFMIEGDPVPYVLTMREGVAHQLWCGISDLRTLMSDK